MYMSVCVQVLYHNILLLSVLYASLNFSLINGFYIFDFFSFLKFKVFCNQEFLFLYSLLLICHSLFLTLHLYYFRFGCYSPENRNEQLFLRIVETTSSAQQTVGAEMNDQSVTVFVKYKFLPSTLLVVTGMNREPPVKNT